MCHCRTDFTSRLSNQSGSCHDCRREGDPRRQPGGGRMSVSTRVAAIDCGTNSVRLLIADISGGEMVELERRMEIVRLGQGVDKTGRLAPEALERTFTAMRGYAKLVVGHEVSRVRV